jgi:FkbM family methyltransferase
MKKTIKKIFLGKKAFQPIFESLYRLALRGMNIGNGGDFTISGEKNMLKIIRTFFEKEATITIFDVGANIGEYSEEIVHTFKGLPFNLYSFEPSKEAFAELFKRKQLNLNTIHKIPLGLSNKEGLATIYTNTLGSKLGSLYQRVVPHRQFDLKEQVTLTTIDSFCSKKSITHINFLKLDIEGNELQTLVGAQKMLSSNSIDIIQFEFGGANIDGRTYLRDFFVTLGKNYIFYRILRDGLWKISSYGEHWELFSVTNYLAVRKELTQSLEKI